MPNKVVNLGQVRDLLAEWNAVREHILSGRVDAFYLAVRDTTGNETVYVGGAYKANPQQALKAAMRVSAAKMMAEDDPLPDAAEFATTRW